MKKIWLFDGTYIGGDPLFISYPSNSNFNFSERVFINKNGNAQKRKYGEPIGVYLGKGNLSYKYLYQKFIHFQKNSYRIAI